jgi:ankyrin repeat protein
VHHSVKNFLLSGSKDLTGIPFTINSAHKKMADIIITYLNYSIFETQLSTMVVPQIPIESAPSKIIHSTLNSNTVRALALKLLKSRERPGHDIGKNLAEASRHFRPRSVDEFHFYSYAKSYWLQHTWCISEQELVMYSLLCKLFRRKAIDANAVDEYGQTPLWWAVKNGHETIVKLLLANDKVDANAIDEYGETPLMWAAKNGHEAIVKLLLANNKVDAGSKEIDGRTPFSWATENCQEDIF